MPNTYRLVVEKATSTGLRPMYNWQVFLKNGFPFDPIQVASGDSYYKWNAKRAANRAAKRHAAGKGEKTTGWEGTVHL